jgi:hypothetical protein
MPLVSIGDSHGIFVLEQQSEGSYPLNIGIKNRYKGAYRFYPAASSLKCSPLLLHQQRSLKYSPYSRILPIIAGVSMSRSLKCSPYLLRKRLEFPQNLTMAASKERLSH